MATQYKDMLSKAETELANTHIDTYIYTHINIYTYTHGVTNSTKSYDDRHALKRTNRTRKHINRYTHPNIFIFLHTHTQSHELNQMAAQYKDMLAKAEVELSPSKSCSSKLIHDDSKTPPLPPLLPTLLPFPLLSSVFR